MYLANDMHRLIPEVFLCFPPMFPLQWGKFGTILTQVFGAPSDLCIISHEEREIVVSLTYEFLRGSRYPVGHENSLTRLVCLKVTERRRLVVVYDQATD